MLEPGRGQRREHRLQRPVFMGLRDHAAMYTVADWSRSGARLVDYDGPLRPGDEGVAERFSLGELAGVHDLDPPRRFRVVRHDGGQEIGVAFLD